MTDCIILEFPRLVATRPYRPFIATSREEARDVEAEIIRERFAEALRRLCKEGEAAAAPWSEITEAERAPWRRCADHVSSVAAETGVQLHLTIPWRTE